MRDPIASGPVASGATFGQGEVEGEVPLASRPHAVSEHYGHGSRTNAASLLRRLPSIGCSEGGRVELEGLASRRGRAADTRADDAGGRAEASGAEVGAGDDAGGHRAAKTELLGGDGEGYTGRAKAACS